MSLAVKLTGIAHSKASEIEESVVPRNYAVIKREPNEKGTDGIAYACYCKGLMIGYVPELPTLRKYYSEARTESKRHEISVWGHAVKSCRYQFKIDYENNGTDEWKASICGLIYCKETSSCETWIEFDEYSELCQQGMADGFVLRQISVLVDGVESF